MDIHMKYMSTYDMSTYEKQTTIKSLYQTQQYEIIQNNKTAL